MKEFTLTVGNRRPLRFNGEILASTITDEAFSEKQIDSKHTVSALLASGNLPNLSGRFECWQPSYDPALGFIWLTLFKTEGGNIVLLEERYSGKLNHKPSSSCHVYASIEECVESNQKGDDGAFGSVTTRLFNIAIENNPNDADLTAAWVQSID